jgi:hypothetical protein
VGLNPNDSPSPRQPRIAVTNIESLEWEEVAWSREVWIEDYETSTGMAKLTTGYDVVGWTFLSVICRGRTRMSILHHPQILQPLEHTTVRVKVELAEPVRMIVASCLVGLFSSAAGYLFAWWVNRRFGLPLSESADFSRDDMQRMATMDQRELPPLGLAVLPILIPLVLIAGHTVLQQPLRSAPPAWQALAATLGDKNVALAIAAAVALMTLVWQKRTSRQRLSEAVQAALASGGVIILITSAGGDLGNDPRMWPGNFFLLFREASTRSDV